MCQQLDKSIKAEDFTVELSLPNMSTVHCPFFVWTVEVQQQSFRTCEEHTDFEKVCSAMKCRLYNALNGQQLIVKCLTTYGLLMGRNGVVVLVMLATVVSDEIEKSLRVSPVY